MNTMSRRNFVALSSTTVLAACASGLSGGSVAAIPATLVQDATLIASGLNAALPALQSSHLLGGGALNTITNLVTQLPSLAGQLAPGLSTAAAQPKVQQIETILNTVVSTAAGVPLPPPFGPALMAASVLLPILEAGVGLLTTQLNVPQAAAMTPDQARAVLSAAAVRRA